MLASKVEQFAEHLLRRTGSTTAALEECRALMLMEECGREFYCQVERGLWARYALEHGHGAIFGKDSVYGTASTRHTHT
jgi:hypothetical protein